MAVRKWLKENAVLVSVGGTLVLIGIAWGTLTSELAGVREQVARIERGAADDLCLAVVQRQIVAIEKGDKEIQRQLRDLGAEQGCLRQYGEDTAFAVVEASSEEISAGLARERQRRIEFEDRLEEIDKTLKPAPDPFDLLSQ